ncbi:MAG TPA: (Fe-S)-binding protein [Fimbriimonadaceae bacterium]|mgnify:CR=1 FL=1|nr:(Fe-S)-binding protein [Fimbriimonadaceae bacterium]
MTVRLMLTCLCDAFYGEVGIATVEVLQRIGCRVEFPAEQTCCGQPPFNAGDWAASRAVAERCRTVFELDDPASVVVTPSSSCAAMLREGYAMLFPDWTLRAQVFEFGEFLVRHRGIVEWPGRLRREEPIRAVYHRACHGRGLHLGDLHERLLGTVEGIEWVGLPQAEQCCGFGGAFSATHPKVSTGIGMEKLAQVATTGAEMLVSGDMGCLMHLKGLLSRQHSPIEVRHFAQVLAEAQ